MEIGFPIFGTRGVLARAELPDVVLTRRGRNHVVVRFHELKFPWVGVRSSRQSWGERRSSESDKPTLKGNGPQPARAAKCQEKRKNTPAHLDRSLHPPRSAEGRGALESVRRTARVRSIVIWEALAVEAAAIDIEQFQHHLLAAWSRVGSGVNSVVDS